MTFLRKSGARDSGRAHDPTRPRPPAADRADADGARRVPGRARRTGSTSTHDELAPDHAGARHARRADGAARRRSSGSTFDAGWMRWGWPERVGGLGGSTLLRAYLGEALTARDLVEPGIYSMTEVLAPTMIDYAAPELAADDGAAAAAGRRDLVPGLLRAGHRQQPRLARRAGPCAPTTAGASPARRCGRAWPSTPSAACCSPAPARRSPPTGASPRCSSTWTRRASPCGRSRRCTARPSSARCSSTTSSCPFDRTLGDEGQGWAVAMDLLPFERSTALWHRGRLPAPPARSSCSTRRRRARSTRPRSARSTQLAVRLPGPVPRHPAPAWPRASTLGAGDVDRQGAAGHRRAGGVRPRRRRPRRRGDARRRPDAASGGAPSSSTRGPPRSTAAAPRSSATSSPAACSTSGTTADGRRRPRAVRAEPRHATERHTGADARRRARRARLARRARDRPARRGRRCCSSSRARPTPRRRRSTASCSARSASTLDADAGVVLPALGRCGPPGELDGDGSPSHGARHRRAGRASRRPLVVATTGDGDGRRRGRHRRRSTLRPVARHRPVARPGRGDRRAASTSAPERRAGRRGPTAVAARPARRRPRARRRVADDARAGPRARARAHPVRPADRQLPGRPPPPGRDASSPSRPPTPCSTPPGSTAHRATAAMAKAIAGRSARTAARHCQQVLAGIGFTTEHALHRYVRRVLVLDELFGSARVAHPRPRRRAARPPAGSRRCSRSDHRRSSDALGSRR